METVNKFFNSHNKLIEINKSSNDSFKCYSETKTEYELEARIKGFFVNQNNCKRFIENHNMEKRVYYEYSKLISKSFYRYRSSEEKIICKSKLLKSHCQDFWFTLNISSEVEIENLISDFFEGIIPRLITRYSMVYKNSTIEIGFDQKIWWVEVERNTYSQSSPNSFFNSIIYVLKQLQKNKNLLRWSDYETIRQITIDYKKPITLNRRNTVDIFSCKWITPKFDGERKFVILRMGRMFVVDTKQNIKFLGLIEKKDDELTILDCEEVNGILYIMDIVNNQEQEKRLNKRFEYEKWFHIKPFYEIESLSDCLKILRDKSVPMDGIIFFGNKILKWKETNTVDLIVKKSGIYASDGKIEGNVYFDESFDESDFIYGKIYEMKVILGDTNEHYIYRLREDKPRPNSKHIYSENTEKTLNSSFFRGYEAIMMRKYHNKVKKQLLSIPKERECLIDIGTGQGGDIEKWKSLSYKNVYCIEPDLKACHESILRMNKNTIINKYLRDFDFNEDIKEESKSLSEIVVTSFFSMNLFQNKDYNSLFRLLEIKNIKYFICICLTEIKKKSNSCFTIKDLGNNNYDITIHGTRITNLNEKIVDEILLMEKLNYLRYDLIREEKLDKCNYMTTEEKELSSCYKLFIFERF